MSVAFPPVEIEFDEESHSYLANGEPVDSVTSIIGDVVPKDLSWWGMQVGINAVCEIVGLDPELTLETVKAKKLTVRDQRDNAAGRGSSVHKALEIYAKDGTVPLPKHYPGVEPGYITGLAKFLIAAEPIFEISEKRVAYPEYGYAGTFDLVVALMEPVELPVRMWYGKVKTAIFEGRGMIDLKTSKYVYPLSHYPQLAAYEAAHIRMGGTPTDWQAVLHVTKEGDYWMKRSNATFEDFLAYKAARDAQKRLKPERGA